MSIAEYLQYVGLEGSQGFIYARVVYFPETKAGRPLPNWQKLMFVPVEQRHIPLHRPVEKRIIVLG
jgi:hypothetical protein